MVKGYDCLSICFTYAENLLNNSIDDYQVYFSFGIRKVGYKEGKLNSNSHGNILDNLNLYGIERKTKDVFEKTETPEEYIKRICEQKKCLILCANTKRLSYRNIFVHNASANHYMCVKDFDENAQKIYIYDGSVTADEEDPFEGWIEWQEVLPAWEDTGFDHFIWDKSHMDREKIADNVRDSFIGTLNHYLNSESKDGFVRGEEAIRTWVKTISDQDDMDQLLHQLKVVGVITIKQYILLYLEHEMEDSIWVEQYRGIVEGWRKLCMLLFFMKLRKRYDALAKFKNEAEALLNEENRILQEVCKNII